MVDDDDDDRKSSEFEEDVPQTLDDCSPSPTPQNSMKGHS